jgi:putative ABC transport system substrate-binding protein
MMRRRTFITLLGGAAAAWPLAARAQRGERMRRIGVLMGWTDADPEFRSWLSAFLEEMERLGWAEGRNLQIERRLTNLDSERAKAYAKELVELRPDVILVGSTAATSALQQQTSTIPIVFAAVSDPVGAGFVPGLPRPGAT